MSDTKEFIPRKEYRKLVKKMQRKRKRQKLAQIRDTEQEHLESDPQYLAKQQEALALRLVQEELEKEIHIREEQKWLENERLAQVKFSQEQVRLKAIEETQKEKLREEQKRRDKLRKEKEARLNQEKIAFDTYLTQIEHYTTGVRNEIPDLLQHSAETNPGRETCGFFSKTSACRFGDSCVKNHIKPGISKILLIRNFFTHIRLYQAPNTEYGGDLSYEYEDGELQKAYEEFYFDAVYEIEKFGEIKNFVTAKQSSPHFRGNVYVEFANQRDALRAFQSLIGRYYAGRQLTIEFSGINNFVQALCGTCGTYYVGKSFRNCCNQGSNCNFIHMFKNPGVKHKIDAFWLQMQWELLKKKQRMSEREENLSWDTIEDPQHKKRHWRWSESPERIQKTDTESVPIKEKSTKDKDKKDRNHKHKKRRHK